MRALVATLVGLIMAAATTAALAAPGAPSGTISGPNGKAALGSVVTFDATVSGLKGWQYPMVEIICRQSGATVWATIDEPSAMFHLGGMNSDWAANGGAADCEARIDAYGFKGGAESIVVLDSATFAASG